MTLNRITIIGLGLMGGSLAMALRRAELTTHIVGCGRPERQRQALDMGVIDSGCEDAGESVKESDFVFLCTPVETSIKETTKYRGTLPPAPVRSRGSGQLLLFALLALTSLALSAAAATQLILLRRGSR